MIHTQSRNEPEVAFRKFIPTLSKLSLFWYHLSLTCWPPLRTPTLPTISNSAQYDFFPFAASSVDIIVYIRLGSGGSYFSLGIPVILKHKHNNHFHYWTPLQTMYCTCTLHKHEAACILTGNRMGATVQRTGEMPSENDTENPLRVRSENTNKSNSKINSRGDFSIRDTRTILDVITTLLKFT